MASMEPLYHLFDIKSKELTKEESIILEVELFTRICDELKEFFKIQHKDYFRLLKMSSNKEDAMIEEKFVFLIIQDILQTNNYTKEGIAYYTDTHTDVIDEILTGINKNPSANFLRKIIELHRSVRSDLYSLIAKKLISRYPSLLAKEA